MYKGFNLKDLFNPERRRCSKLSYIKKHQRITLNGNLRDLVEKLTNKEFAELVRRCVNLDYSDGLYNLAHIAARYGTVKKFRSIIKRRGDLLNSQGLLERTPLHMAALYGRLKMTKFILRCGANIEAPDSCGDFPLFNACRNGHLNIVKALMTVDKFIIYDQDKLHGNSFINAIDFACLYRLDKSAKLVEFLIQQGVFISQSVRNLDLSNAPKLRKLIREN